jgi:hypothetical protein
MRKIFIMSTLCLFNIFGCSKSAEVALTLPDGYTFKYDIKITKAYIFDDKTNYKLIVIMRDSGKPFIKDDEEEIHIYISKPINKMTQPDGYFIRLQTRPTMGRLNASNLKVINNNGKYSAVGHVFSEQSQEFLTLNIPTLVLQPVMSYDELLKKEDSYFLSLLQGNNYEWKSKPSVSDLQSKPSVSDLQN